MADLITAWDAEGHAADWLLRDGDLASGDDLRTAAIISLATHGVVSDEAMAADHTLQRGGWWADYEADAIWGAPVIGSRLRILQRAKVSALTPSLAETMAREALAWMLDRDRRLASAVNASADWLDRYRTSLGLTVTIVRDGLDDINLRYQPLWSEF